MDDDDIAPMLVSVRADTAAFARDVEAMRGSLDGVLATGAERAGRAIETSLLRAVRTGKLGFEELQGIALSALDAIARSALRAGVSSVFGGDQGEGLGGALAGLLGGLPGRATGGAVSPGRAYVVGERGPEMFVPSTSGRVEAAGSGSAVREVRVAITVNAAAGSAPGVLAQSGRQVARAVKAALAVE